MRVIMVLSLNRAGVFFKAKKCLAEILVNHTTELVMNFQYKYPL